MATMRAARIPSPGADFELITRERTEPGPRQVEIRVAACGVCHSDSFVKAGQFPGLQLPRVPGHEVVGVIDRIGPGVEGWKPGDRVGVGWHGGHDFVCESCRAGDFITCRNELISGFGSDGGYAEYMIARIEALARVPAGLSDAEAAPLMCAGITTFNALRHSLARGGDTVAVLGLGGLGHLGVQFASKFGFYTVASHAARTSVRWRSSSERRSTSTPRREMRGSVSRRSAGRKSCSQRLRAPRAIEETIEGLAPGGQLMLIGAPHEPLSVSAGALLLPRLSIQGWPSGHAKDSEETLQFCARFGVRPMVETFPLERAAEAFDRMMTGRVRFRSVITMPAKAG
jgi:D-arabinose 1-dehydrogenase-like Zn-dependent alcohol dehydrogenase